ncbi:MAG TPA: DUF6496 domain-containing protein [Rhizomicrobium sp.]|nr:DUF6496 domain-containing protein [Rhizomicrobium sp.]
MAKTSPRQRKSIGRVMHEYKHGELKSGRRGRGGKVKSRRQAIAIALHEGGASKNETKSENKRDFARTKSKERHGETAQQEREGKSHVGARGRRESSRAMGGENAKRTTARGRKAAHSRSRGGPTRAELYQRAKRKHIRGASRMTKQQLQNALR